MSPMNQEADCVPDGSWTAGEEGRVGLRLGEVGELTCTGLLCFVVCNELFNSVIEM